MTSKLLTECIGKNVELYGEGGISGAQDAQNGSDNADGDHAEDGSDPEVKDE